MKNTQVVERHTCFLNAISICKPAYLTYYSYEYQVVSYLPFGVPVLPDVKIR